MNLCFVTITVKSLQKSLNFYQEIIGLKELRSFSPRPGVKIVFLQDGRGSKVELIEYSEAATTKTEEKIPVSLGFAVDNMEKTITMLKEKEIQITGGPMKVPNGETLLFVQDPDGVGITFIEGFKD